MRPRIECPKPIRNAYYQRRWYDKLLLKIFFWCLEGHAMLPYGNFFDGSHEFKRRISYFVELGYTQTSARWAAFFGPKEEN